MNASEDHDQPLGENPELAAERFTPDIPEPYRTITCSFKGFGSDVKAELAGIKPSTPGIDWPKVGVYVTSFLISIGILALWGAAVMWLVLAIADIAAGTVR